MEEYINDVLIDPEEAEVEVLGVEALDDDMLDMDILTGADLGGDDAIFVDIADDPGML